MPHALLTVLDKCIGENICPVPNLLHGGISFAICCINVRLALLRNGEGQEMLSVVNTLLYH